MKIIYQIILQKYIIIFLLLLAAADGYAQNLNLNLNTPVKPYKDVITSEVLTKKGFVTIHQFNNKLYLEIPSTVLGKDLLFIAHGESGNAYTQVKWIKKEHKIHLIIPEIKSEIGNTIPLIKNKFNEVIIALTFPILTIGKKDSSYVIDVTNLFLKPPKGLPGTGKTIFDGLAFITKVKAFENTIEIETHKTITSNNGPIPVDANFSLFLLPEPMMPRLYDHRMGFGDSFDPLNFDPLRTTIKKWRLEKKYKDKELSEPIRPITLYFDPATPDKWRPYIKAGIEEWLPAFEAAGFKNAIEVKKPPINDKNWSENSMRYSYIRWSDRSSKYRGNESQNVGSVDYVIDQRTGEILQSVINIGETGVLMQQYFVRCSPLDKRVQQYPLPDDVMGEIFQFIVAHEAGHVFGLRDSNYGEYTYPFENMRDKTWLQSMGHTPSVMNYTRQNYIVQPEDSIPPRLLQQKVGPTDLYSIRWGYTPFYGAKTPDEELSYLEKIVKEQDSVSWYRFSANHEYDTGPSGTNEVVECDNPMKAALLGTQNLKRAIALIPQATRHERGSKIKRSLHNAALNLWVDQMKLVASLVGGFTIQYKSGNQEGAVYTPVPEGRQKEAVAFLNTQAFHPPLWMVPTDLTRSYSPGSWEESGTRNINSSLDMISGRQLKILSLLLRRVTLEKIEEIDLTTKNAYSIEAFFQDLNKGLWSELASKNIRINPYRQQLQTAYIECLKVFIQAKRKTHSQKLHTKNRKYIYSNYIRSAALNALKEMEVTIKKVRENTHDLVTKGHLELCLLEINRD